jgi:signal transduction histidine kinase/ActR/RegA family two-component response regulator
LERSANRAESFEHNPLHQPFGYIRADAWDEISEKNDARAKNALAAIVRVIYSRCEWTESPGLEAVRAGKYWATREILGNAPGPLFMHTSARSPAIQHLAAVLMVGAAAVLTGVLWKNIFPAAMWPLFLVAVAVSAFIGGFWAGMTATVTSLLAIGGLIWLLGEDVHQLRVQDVLRILSIMPVGLIVSLLLFARLRAETALRERDARLQLVSRQIPGALWSTDAGLVVTSGFGAQSEIVHGPPGHTLYEHFQTGDGSFAPISAHRQALRGESSRYDLEWGGRTFQCYVEPLRDVEGGIIGVVGVATDITDRQRAEAEQQRLLRELEKDRALLDTIIEDLRRAKQELESANQSKDRFLAMLSHELRTPLAPVLALASSLQDRPELSEDVREQVETIRRNVELEARLIDDLLDLTRISRGKLNLNTSDVDAHDLVRNAIDICREDAAHKGIEIVAELSARRHFVRADAARLQQVFWNLIKNAIKFTGGGGMIAIRTATIESDGIRVEVTDTGIGITPEVLPRIFEAFEQGSTSITRKFGGLGLGLSISKTLVEAHHGRITAHSAGEGRGATFCVELETVEVATEEPINGDPSAAGRAAALRILLVEDHADTARVMQMLLKSAGHRVEIAASVEAATRVLEEHDMDLLITDIGLPDGTGHDLMKLAAARYRLRGIALSGYGAESDIQQSLQAGFEAHLTKPVPMVTLTQAIQRVAKMATASREQ